MRLLATLLALAGGGLLCLVALGVFAWRTPIAGDDGASDVAASVAGRFLLWSVLGAAAVVASVVVFLVAARRGRGA